MKRVFARLAVTLGTAAMAPALMAQSASAQSVGEVCTDPGRAGESQALWNYVQSEDRTEVYIAYLEACGASPLTAEFAAIARAIVIERTANFQNMPDATFRLVLNANSADGFSAAYVS